ncbi:MAG: CHRD domain-containing protein [Gemmatimonadaceae bacterium]
MTVQVRVLSVVTMFAAVVTMTACDDDEPSAPVVPTEVFTATINGAQERPNPANSNGTGTARLTLFANDSIQFDVKIGTIDSVTLSHIHAGDPTVSGSIIFGWPNQPAPTNFPSLVQFHLGTIYRTSTFSGIFANAGFDSLVTRMRAGTAYVNVHTRRFPAGEIRGNLSRRP